MKPYYLMMAAMSALVFTFGIPGTADYFLSRRADYFTSVTTTTAPFFQTVKSGETDQKVGLWRYKTFRVDLDGKEIDGTKDSFKITDDTRLPCKGFRQHIQAASAFAILTVIFSVVALAGFGLNIIGNEAPIGFAGGAGTILMGMITWAIMAAIRNRPHCKGESIEVHLDTNDFKYYHGFYFFLIPWILYVITFIVAIIMKAGDKSGDSSSSSRETKTEETVVKSAPEEKSDKNESEKPVEEQKSENKDEDDKRQQEENKKAEEAKAKEAENAKAEEEKKKQDEEKKRQEEEERKKKAEEAEKKRQQEEKERIEAEKKAAAEEEAQAKAEEEEMAKKLNEEDVERRKKIWADLKERLPTNKKDKEQRRRRFDLFKEFDRGEKKYLTPDDLDHGCKHVLGLGQLKKGLAHILPKAHASARSVNQAKGKSKTTADENVERCEFRLVFVHIKELFDFWFQFDEINVDNNGHISKDEFEKGADKLKGWGYNVTGDLEGSFDAADASKNGKITFSDFCDWARKPNPEDDEDATDNDENPEDESADELAARNKADVERRKKIWEDLAHRLPTNKKSKEERARRFQYFREFDTNNNGYLTLADVEEGCATVLGLGQLGKGLHHILPLAHNSARGVANVKGQDEKAAADQHVEKSEMRLLFVYIHQYFDLWWVFDTLDVANTGHISYDEFVKGVHEVEAWAGVKIDDPKAEFEAADSGKTNQLIFLEFCEWAHHKNTKDE